MPREAARVGTEVASPPGAAAAARPAPATGARSAGGSAAEIGGLAVSADGARIGVSSRPQGLTGQGALVEEFTATPAFVITRAPAQFAASRTSGIGWAPDRFIAGAVTD